MDCADFIRVSNFLRRQSNIESAKRALKEIFRCWKIIIKVANLDGVSMSLVGQDRSFIESRIRKWKQDVASNPQDYEALASIGAAYGKLGDNTTALTYFEDAIAVNPSYAEAFVGLGSACAFLRKADEAVAALRKAISLDPESPLAHAKLGTTLGRAGMYQDAIIELKEALRLKPDLTDASFALGLAYVSIGDWHQAAVEANSLSRADRNLAAQLQNFIDQSR